MQLNNHGGPEEQLRLLKAINELKTQCAASFDILRTALKVELRGLDNDLRDSEGPALHRIQGHAKRLHDLCEFLDASRDLQKMVLATQQRKENT